MGRTLRYVEYNAVCAGLVACPEQYRWSSAAAHLGGCDTSEILDLDYWGSEGGKERWACLLAEPEDLVAIRLLRRCTYAGRPFGEESFVQSIEKQFERTWRQWSF